MSIEIENPEGVAGKVDAAWNLVEQIGLALNIGDVGHAKQAKAKASRLLALAMEELEERASTESPNPGPINAKDSVEGLALVFEHMMEALDIDMDETTITAKRSDTGEVLATATLSEFVGKARKSVEGC